jgi:hypothetical protein
MQYINEFIFKIVNFKKVYHYTQQYAILRDDLTLSKVISIFKQ